MILFPTGQPTSPETFEDYLASGGYAAATRNILEEVTASGLRGRGGAGFPVGRKWSVAAETEADVRYIVCNAGEDEPGSFKDRLLLEHRPHLVLEGMILAARAIGANQAYLYLNETYDDCFSRMTTAIAEARAAGQLHDITVSIHKAPTVYVAGEDSAAVEVLEGKEAKPRPKPPYPAAAGLWGKPTVVNNVETLANVPPIVRNGAAWFRSYGTSESPGTMIFCLGDEMKNPGAFELPFGTPLRQLFANVGGGLKDGRKLKAILPGGPSCAFLTPDQIDIPLDPESLKRAGSTLGCGVMRFYDEDACMVEATLRLAQFFAKESCGQCPACRMETSMLAAMLERIHQGKGDAALLPQFQKVIDFNRGKGYCALVNMPGPPVMSALRLFSDEFDRHIQYGACGP
jgi:NADH:ubiquinone oxidoreductase subunit F (NADH-binding)